MKIIIAFCLICGGFLWVLKYLRGKEELNKQNPAVNTYGFSDDTEKAETENLEEFSEFDKAYFERCQKGEPHQLFLKFSSLQDCTLLQGLLFAGGISSHIEHQHMNRIYPGSNTIANIFAVQLWILVSDYEAALEIVSQFISQKRNSLNTSDDSVLAKTLKKLLGLLTAPFPVSKSQQILGISIFPKEQTGKVL
ncbi:MAG: hypothetical protein PUF61_10670 [Spirochaetales bacterium]|nr:hypothetical protein [Spirochaetales bacterium]